MHFANGCWGFKFVPTNGFSIQPLKVQLLAGEQVATEIPFSQRNRKRFLLARGPQGGALNIFSFVLNPVLCFGELFHSSGGLF